MNNQHVSKIFFISFAMNNFYFQNLIHYIPLFGKIFEYNSIRFYSNLIYFTSSNYLFNRETSKCQNQYTALYCIILMKTVSIPFKITVSLIILILI